MNDSMTDEQFAKWLQDQEFREQREGSSGAGAAQHEERVAAERADAEYAQRLASEQLQQQQQQPRQQTRSRQQTQPRPPNSAIALQHGQTIAVRLQHPSSRNQVDEALYAHHMEHNVMMFEMVRKRGNYLRVKDTSETEFSKIVDESSKFIVENTAQGMIYLSPRKHNQKVNLSGTVGWMLALTQSGSLVGNSARGSMSQWRLLAAADAPPYTPLPNSTLPVSGCGSSTSTESREVHPMDAGSDVLNPLSSLSLSTEAAATTTGAAKAKSQIEWLDTAVGQTWLSQDIVGRSQLRQLHEEGKLRGLVYRPDWPISALTWKDYARLHHQYLSQPFPDITKTNNGGTLPAINFQEFFEKGFTVCPGALDTSFTQAALKMVNYWLGQYPNHPSINAQGNIDLRGEILTDQSVMALLYETSLLHSIKGFFKDNFVIEPCLECQICVKYPDFSATGNIVGYSGKRWQIDKLISTTASLIVGIPLSTTTASSTSVPGGNICVYPCRQSETFDAARASQVVRDSMSDVMDTSKPDFGEPEQLHLAIGDVLFLSPFTPRREAPNFSPNTNYTVSQEAQIIQGLLLCGTISQTTLIFFYLYLIICIPYYRFSFAFLSHLKTGPLWRRVIFGANSLHHFSSNRWRYSLIAIWCVLDYVTRQLLLPGSAAAHLMLVVEFMHTSTRKCSEVVCRLYSTHT